MCSTPPCLEFPTPTHARFFYGGSTLDVDPFDAVCGNVHFPPNGTSHYDYFDPVPVTSSQQRDKGEVSVKNMHPASNPPAAPTEIRSSAPQPKASAPTSEALPLNERKFTVLARRIAALPKYQRSLLQLLTEKNRAMGVQEIAAWLNIQENSISKNPPTDLLRLRLVERDRHRDGFHYRSVLRNYLQIEFPGIEVETLVHRLFTQD